MKPWHAVPPEEALERLNTGPRRPQRGRGDSTAGRYRSEPPDATRRPERAVAVRGPVQQYPDPRADRRRRRQRPAGRDRRCHGDRGRRRRSTRHRLHPGRQGGTGAEGHPRDAVAQRRRGARGPAHDHPGGRPGTRRSGASGVGRPGARRPPPDRHPQPSDRGIGADRRIPYRSRSRSSRWPPTRRSATGHRRHGRERW